jgi:hypothetical protein
MSQPTHLQRIPAKTLADIALSDDVFKADFEITDKYQAFSGELLRLALLGIAGYGFFIGNVALNNAQASEFYAEVLNQSGLLIAGLTLLALAAAFAVAHRFFSTDCLSHQITILRILRRITSPDWSEVEKDRDRARLDDERIGQRRDLLRCRNLLIGSSVALVCGVVCSAAGFALILLGLDSTAARP